MSEKKQETTLLSKKRRAEITNTKKETSITISDAYNLTEEEKYQLIEEKEKEKNYILNNLPMSHFYTKSYMHKDFIDHIISSPKTDFIFTSSTDGIIKFWKKNILELSL